MKSIRSIIKSKSIDELLLGALVFLLPFERIPSIDVFGLSLRMSFIVAGILIIKALHSAAKNHFSIIEDTSAKLVLFFCAWVVITILVSINTTRAVQVAIYTTFTIMTALAIRELYRPKYLQTVISALLGSATIVAIFGIYQYFGNMAGFPNAITGIRSSYSWQVFGFPRIHSTALEPLYYCSYLLIPVSYLLLALLDYGQKKMKYIALFVLFVTSIFMSLSRGGIFAFVIVSIAGIAIMRVTQKAAIINIIRVIGLIALSAAIALSIISIVSREPLNKKITKGQKGAAGYTSQLQKTNGDDRAEMRVMAASILAEDNTKLFIGIGPGQFGPYTQDAASAAKGWKIVNNEPLELMLEYGLVGAALFLVFLATVLSKAFLVSTKVDTDQKMLTLTLLIYCLGLAIQYQTFSTLYIMHVWVVLGLLMSLGAGLYKPGL